MGIMIEVIISEAKGAKYMGMSAKPNRGSICSPPAAPRQADTFCMGFGREHTTTSRGTSEVLAFVLQVV